ncbi:MAG: thiamine phosphate synthase [Endomicrobium sp.]|nr:thiamine phosphate synthase [Endomicrobium sp.]
MKKEMPKGLYAITAERFSNVKDNITVVKEMLDAGIKTLQYREKDKTKLEKFRQCETIRKLTENYGVFFVVNDDIDIALAVKSDGFHIGQNDLPFEEAKKIAGADMVIGLSTHSPAQAKLAVELGADNIGAGPVFKTFTKENADEPVGLKYLEFCANNIKTHKIAIGGIKLSNLAEVCAYKPESICMVTEITASQNIGKTVKEAMRIINDNR